MPVTQKSVKKSSQRRQVATTTLVSLALWLTLTTTPAKALTINLNQLLGKFATQLYSHVLSVGGVSWGDFIKGFFFSFAGEITNYLTDELTEAIQKVAPGVLGPKATEVRQKVKQQVLNSQKPVDRFGLDRSTAAEYAARETDRLNTMMQVDSVLSTQGQTATEKAIEDTQATIESIAETAEFAQGLNVTQDVMKSLVSVQAQQSELIGQLRTEQLRSRIDAQYTNLNLANISRSLDEISRKDRVEGPAAADGLLRLSTQAQAPQ